MCAEETSASRQTVPTADEDASDPPSPILPSTQVYDTDSAGESADESDAGAIGVYRSCSLNSGSHSLSIELPVESERTLTDILPLCAFHRATSVRHSAV